MSRRRLPAVVYTYSRGTVRAQCACGWQSGRQPSTVSNPFGLGVEEHVNDEHRGKR